MQNIKTVSSKQILQRVSTMFGINNSNWHADAIDWIGDAIQAIGYHVGFVEKTIDIKITNYRANIPNELESLDFIEYNGHRLILGKDNTDYGFVRRQDYNRNVPLANYGDALQLQKEIDRLNVLQEQLDAEPNNQDLIDAIIETNRIIDGFVKQLRLGAFSQTFSEYYNIEGDYIKTTFASGITALTGQCFRVDKEGLPEVIDTFNYKEAISWFIIYRLILQGYSHPEIKMGFAKEEWESYTYKASNEAKMPSIDELERFTQRWLTVKRISAEKLHNYSI